MKAVILAGGMGTRLRPITYSMPKPLVPLVDRPMVMHIIDSLPAEVDTVILAVSYMKDRLVEHFRMNDCGRDIILVNEEAPLGTGGALKNVAKHLDDTFFAFNGDVVCSIDLKDMLRCHRSRKGIGSIALWDVEDPTAFGVVGSDRDERIAQFQEKPKREEAVSNSINAGVYIFELDVLDRIGTGVVSLEREIFPNVLKEGLYGYRFGGHWVDCGTRENYIRAQSILLDNGKGQVRDCVSSGPVQMFGNNYLNDVRLEGCSIGPNVVALSGVTVGKGARVNDSMLMSGVIVGEGAVVSNSLIGPGVKVNPGEIVEGTILA
jgi:mannose-1-phosphate guanylyltransferase